MRLFLDGLRGVDAFVFGPLFVAAANGPNGGVSRQWALTRCSPSLGVGSDA
ncbi:MAG: hypothetical protein KY451_05735 [Actinobacteria bacterium]|nr:hypothetical protein [Actinomycetota bacterium]